MYIVLGVLPRYPKHTSKAKITSRMSYIPVNVRRLSKRGGSYVA